MSGRRDRRGNSWFVTGGAGFIGSHFLEHLIEREPSATVVCFDALTYVANPEVVPPEATLVHGDIRFRHHVADVIRRTYPDFVVNFAAESHVDNSYSQVGLFTETNVNGVAVIADVLKSTPDIDPLFVQISTDEVYGDSEWGDQVPGSADPVVARPLNPQNPYAATKAAAEFILNSFARSFGLRTMVTRSSNNWGPRQHPEKFIPAALRAKATGEEMVVHGYDYRRDWLNVQDNVRAIYELITRAGTGTWDIATGEQHTLYDVLTRIGNVPHTVRNDRPGVDKGYWVDASATWDFLGWEPQDLMSDPRWDDYVAAELPEKMSST